jgi:hypothetical protein
MPTNFAKSHAATGLDIIISVDRVAAAPNANLGSPKARRFKQTLSLFLLSSLFAPISCNIGSEHTKSRTSRIANPRQSNVTRAA